MAIPAMTAMADPLPARNTTLQACYGQAQTQYDINDCSQHAAQRAQTELDTLYRAVLAKYRDDPHLLRRLRAAQKAWERYRDAEFAAVYPHSGDPDYAADYTPTCSATLKLALTRSRIARLRLWLRGGIEGDLCAGAIRPGEAADPHPPRHSAGDSPTPPTH